MSRPKIRLSRLRDIGWRCWDPIAIGDRSGAWPDDAADEYDGYLLKAAGMVRNGISDKETVDYLVWAEVGYMGMGVREDTRTRAEATIEAIRADDQLWSES